MPENDAHIPGMNAVSFVAYCGQLAGLGGVDAIQRAHEVLYYVGLGEARYRNVETYSTGMKQRIKLAQALVHDPDLLFLDEPTNGMDPKGRDEMLELIRDLAHNKGVNLILSSHLLPDVEYTCDRVVVMDKGRIAAQGPIAELKGPRGSVYELRAKIDADRLVSALRAAGMDCHATDEDVMRVFVPGGAHRACGLRSGGPRAHTAPAPAPERAHARRRVCPGGRRRVAMPIHDQGYRRFGGNRGLRGNAWLVIAGTAMRTMLRNRKFMGLLLLAWAPFLVRAVQVYASTNFPQVAFLAPTAKTFREFLEQQNPFVFFVTVYVGAGLISNDRRANALQIYLSKPLTRVEYVAGKAAALIAFLLFVTWVPALLLLFVQILLAGSFAFVQKNLFLFPAITVFACLQVLMAAFTMLALSSLSKSSRFVAVMYAGIILFTGAIQTMFWAITRSSAASLISPTASLNQIGDVIFRVPPRYETPVALSVLVIGLLIAGSILVLERRVRGVEVVA